MNNEKRGATTSVNSTPRTWEQAVVEALGRLGGQAHLSKLYKETAAVRKEAGYPLSATYRATIRRTCQQAKQVVQDDKGSGVWRLVSHHAIQEKEPPRVEEPDTDDDEKSKGCSGSCESCASGCAVPEYKSSVSVFGKSGCCFRLKYDTVSGGPCHGCRYCYRVPAQRQLLIPENDNYISPS